MGPYKLDYGDDIIVVRAAEPPFHITQNLYGTKTDAIEAGRFLSKLTDSMLVDAARRDGDFRILRS